MQRYSELRKTPQDQNQVQIMGDDIPERVRSNYCLEEDLLLTVLPGPAQVALTLEVLWGQSWAWGEGVAWAEVSPGAAAIAVAKAEAAELSVSPQRPDEWAQDAVYVVSEEDALMLEDGRGEDLTDRTHKLTNVWWMHKPTDVTDLRFSKFHLPPEHHAGGSQCCALSQRVQQVRLHRDMVWSDALWQ